MWERVVRLEEESKLARSDPLEAARRTEEHLATLIRRVEAPTARLGDLADEAVARRYRERAFAYLWRIGRGLAVLPSGELDELLGEVAEAGGLTEGEEEDVRLADAILEGRRPDDAAEVIVVLEAAATLDAEDVERALRRSAVLARGRRPVVPVVAGRRADPALAERAPARRQGGPRRRDPRAHRARRRLSAPGW